jgi:hypothetical protein
MTEDPGWEEKQRRAAEQERINEEKMRKAREAEEDK